MLRLFAAFCFLGVVAFGSMTLLAEESKSTTTPLPKTAPAEGWQPLFDGKSLDGWKQTDFAGSGEIKVENGQLVIGAGQTLSGITYKNGDKLPKDEFEISLQAMKVKGDDFFCGLTFPVRDSYASFIVGGWAGTVVGLSNIDGLDASENETTTYKKFEHNKWYTIRVKVADDRIECWVDNDKMVDVPMKDKKFSTRIEVDASQPLGVSTYQVTAAIKDFKIRKLKK
jgi:hypothetical protein